MRRRLARIVPLYVAHLRRVSRGWSTRRCCRCRGRRLALQLGSHLLFLHNLHPWLHGAINGPNWSVAAEMQFYVLVIVAVPLLSRMDVRWLIAGGVLVAWASRALAFFATRDAGQPECHFRLCNPGSRHARCVRDRHRDRAASSRRHDEALDRERAARFRCWSRRALSPSTSISSGTATGRTRITGTTAPWSSSGAPASRMTFGALVLVAAQLPDIARFVASARLPGRHQLRHLPMAPAGDPGAEGALARRARRWSSCG